MVAFLFWCPSSFIRTPVRQRNVRGTFRWTPRASVAGPQGRGNRRGNPIPEQSPCKNLAPTWWRFYFGALRASFEPLFDNEMSGGHFVGRPKGGPEPTSGRRGIGGSERQSEPRTIPVLKLLATLVAFFVWPHHGVRRTPWFDNGMSGGHSVGRPKGGPESTFSRRGICGSGRQPEPRTIPVLYSPPIQVASC